MEIEIIVEDAEVKTVKQMGSVVGDKVIAEPLADNGAVF